MLWVKKEGKADEYSMLFEELCFTYLTLVEIGGSLVIGFDQSVKIQLWSFSPPIYCACNCNAKIARLHLSQSFHQRAVAVKTWRWAALELLLFCIEDTKLS